MNQCNFSGNLVSDPESKVMSNGKARCTFRLAIQRQYKNREGVREADFLTFVCYDARADVAQKYLAKGRHVIVTAHVQTGKYEAQNGETVFTTNFIVDNIEMTPGRRDDAQGVSPMPCAPTQNAPTGSEQVDDDDLPF